MPVLFMVVSWAILISSVFSTNEAIERSFRMALEKICRGKGFTHPQHQEVSSTSCRRGFVNRVQQRVCNCPTLYVKDASTMPVSSPRESTVSCSTSILFALKP